VGKDFSVDSQYYSAPHSPPCARYEGGEDDQRLLAVWTFVSGLIGGGENAVGISANVARLFDYKGQLVVAIRQPLLPHIEGLFRYAWEVVGNEPSENVEFVDVLSAAWNGCWSGRRFESDWKP
jgi:hypothetical protein